MSGWRRASTVILLDSQEPGGLMVLLIHRLPAMQAFGGFWAFPGGQVDAQDGVMEWGSRVNPPIAWLVEQMQMEDARPALVNTPDYLWRMHISAEEAHAWLPSRSVDELWPHWIAAVRETYEETGIGLAGWPKGRLNLDDLFYIGRLAAPPFVAHRFDTRFFVRAIRKQPLSLAVGEIDDWTWVSIDEALSQTTYALANPTRYVLDRIASYQTLSRFMEVITQRRIPSWKP